MINTVPVLETPRLTLRGWRETDFPGFAAFCADETTRRFIPGAETEPKAWQRMCGFAGFFHPPDWPEPELGRGAVPAYRGPGFVTEAARRIRAFACQNLGWKTLVSLIHSENHPSVQVALRRGATHERDHELREKRLGAWRHPSPAQCHD